ncbi:helix-turn-helix domain-containing protein [Microlunatus sp. GCM10028923]|uniref:helix-turn-helix domain-containing protein n=1 Tax=Microlunatus sp. GCM10028923 TaxID=3273400 RepID=UPI00361A20AF
MMQRAPQTARERYGFACWTGRARAMESAHAHDEIELNLSDAGPLHYLIGGRTQHLPTGRPGLFWGSTPHQLIEVSPQTRLIWMTVPLDRFLSWQLPDTLLAALFRGEIVHAAGDPELDRAIMLRWATEFERSPAYTEIVALEARAVCQRIALGLDPAADRDHSGPASFAGSPVAIMAGFISRSYREPIRVADVAAAAHLSPQHAMELFHATIGLTIGGYLLQCRIAEAQRLLLTGDHSIARIALDAGFGSLSRFHAAFRAVTGTTPARYRRQGLS